MTRTTDLSRSRYASPYPDQAARASAPRNPAAAEASTDPLPVLKVSDIPSMERLSAIRDYAHRSIADIDQVLGRTASRVDDRGEATPD